MVQDFYAAQSGEAFASQSAVTVSALVGRLLAVMCHPVLAWRCLRPSGRVALAAGYAGLSYLTALLALLAGQ